MNVVCDAANGNLHENRGEINHTKKFPKFRWGACWPAFQLPVAGRGSGLTTSSTQSSHGNQCPPHHFCYPVTQSHALINCPSETVITSDSLLTSGLSLLEYFLDETVVTRVHFLAHSVMSVTSYTSMNARSLEIIQRATIHYSKKYYSLFTSYVLRNTCIVSVCVWVELKALRLNTKLLLHYTPL